MTKYSREDFGKVVVLMGGESAEREISLVSGKNIYDALLRSGIDAHALDVEADVIEKLISLKPDRAFIALHGPGGEDGAIQGVLEYLGIPYTGSDLAASAVTMDKSLTKLIWESTNVPTLRFKLVRDLEAAISVMQEFGLPLCIKPTSDGSSVGVSKVTTPEQLPEAFNKAAVYDDRVMIEPWVEGAEFTVGILGDSPLPVIEIQTPRSFYDFDAKYNEETTRYIVPCGMAPEREQALQDLAFRAFQVTGCRGWGRVDLIQDHVGNFWFLEINTVPGMTKHSLVPKAAEVLGINFDELVVEILSYTVQIKDITQSAAA
ncbi:MAG: D-alanine--D-alanine ligase [Gammaproteobacteria bacterium]|nr:D-alanine--D-alanine ligase [Gammaproteobacteria bacterium]